jgi:hypothetical protein
MECPRSFSAEGIAGQYGVDVYNNVQARGLSVNAFTTNLSSPQTYLTRAAQGAIIAGTGGLAGGYLGLGLVGQSVAVGVTSGTVGALGNAYLGQPVTAQSVGIDTFLGAATFGASEFAPGVSGRLPNAFTDAFFTGAHTQQNALKLGIDAGSNYLGSILTSMFTAPLRTTTYAPTGGMRTFTTPSGAVVDGGGFRSCGHQVHARPIENGAGGADLAVRYKARA